jgi:hypothetical protein
VKRDDFASLVCAVAILIVLCASANAVRLRGPITLRRPATILSASGTGPETAERFLQFLAETGRRVPPGASISLLWAGHRSTDDDRKCWFSSVGQLPAQRVLFAGSLDRRNPHSERPDYVGSFGGPWNDPDYDLLATFSGGSLYGARR